MVPNPTLSKTAEHWRSRLLLLRAHMAQPVAFDDDIPGEAPGDTSELMALDPEKRLITLELLQDGTRVATWEMTGRELGLDWDPEAMIRLRQRYPKLRSLAGSLAAHGAEVLSEWAPRLVSRMKAESWRRDYMPDLALPFAVGGGLETLLDRLAPERSVVWFAVDEPAGYIPHLNWERLLRPHVKVPMVRLPSRLVDPVSQGNSLDVLLTCSTASARLLAAPTRVVQLVKQILASIPSPLRCVVHVFADEIYRPAIHTALLKAKVAVTEGTEPEGQRGVIVYRHDGGGGSISEGLDATKTSEHPWGTWVTRSLGGKAVDVIHVIADGDLSPSIACLKVSELPWGSTGEHWPTRKPDPEPRFKIPIPFLKSNRKRRKAVVVRYVDALQMRDFARNVGAWVTVISAAKESGRVAHRVLVHRLSQIATGIFAVHEFDDDSGEKGIGAFYRLLLQNQVTSDGKKQKPEGPVPDSPTVSFYCHPDRIPGGVMSGEHSLQDLSATGQAAVDRIRAVMEEPSPTPAWLAATQRSIENTAADWAEVGPATERDAAAREGVLDALEFALKAIAETSGSTGAPQKALDLKEGATE